MSFSPDEIERYARHLVIKEIGGPGQTKLKAARVAVVGAGGLGAPCLMYLAAAGIGTLVIIDEDQVALSNLQRQVIHRTDAVGAAKTDSAAAMLRAMNDKVQIVAHANRLDSQSASALLAGADVVVDGSDSLETRHVLADACEAMRVPLVTAAVSVWDGSLTVVAPHIMRANGRSAPRYRDLFPAAPAAGTLPTCAETGVVGALTGMLGTMQAMEVIKLIAGAGEPLIGKLLLVDALTMRFETIEF